MRPTPVPTQKKSVPARAAGDVIVPFPRNNLAKSINKFSLPGNLWYTSFFFFFSGGGSGGMVFKECSVKKMNYVWYITLNGTLSFFWVCFLFLSIIRFLSSAVFFSLSAARKSRRYWHPPIFTCFLITRLSMCSIITWGQRGKMYQNVYNLTPLFKGHCVQAKILYFCHWVII